MPSHAAGAPTTAPPPNDAAVQAARMVLWLVRNPRAWVHRRVETCSFVDDRWARRRVSLDFTLPEAVEDRPVEGVLDVVPLSLLSKRSLLRGFDLRDEDNRALPALTSTQNTAMAVAALESLAGQLLHRTPHRDVRSDLADIAGGTRREIDEARARMRKDADGPAPHPDALPMHQRWTLMHEPSFSKVMADLADGFLLLTPFDTTGTRRVMKFAYEDPLDATEPTWRRAAVRLGWMPARLVLPTPAAGSAQSFHCEIEAPPGLEIVYARLTRGKRLFADVAGLPERERRRREAMTAAINRSLEAHDGGGIDRAHLRLPRPDRPTGEKARVEVSLRVRRQGFLRPALMTCALTAVLLAAGRERLPELAHHGEAASPLLLIIPGLLAAYLSRPGEHALASSLLAGVRAMLLLSGFCAIAAGALLIVRLHAQDLRCSWTVLQGLSVLALIAVAVANVVPRRGKQHAGQADR